LLICQNHVNTDVNVGNFKGYAKLNHFDEEKYIDSNVSCNDFASPNIRMEMLCKTAGAMLCTVLPF